MPISDDIAAIRAGNGTDDEKRAQVYALKCGSLYDALLPFVGQTYRYGGIDYTLWNLWLEAEGTVLCIAFKAVRPAAKNTPEEVLVTPQRVWRFVNPPVLTKAAVDDRITAAREMIAGLL
jgi:hypothetical protein